MAEEDRDETGDRRGESFLRMIFENIDQYAFGIITQHGYQELENKLNAHALEIERKFHKWFVRGLVAFGIMGICCTVSLVGFGVLIGKQSSNTNQIQQQRRDFVRNACTDQNKRNDDTNKKLVAAMNDAIKKHPKRREEIRQSSQVSIGLINALVPKQDCAQLVREATQ